MCPTGMRATGFALKTEIYQGSTGDDTSVNGITLLCGDGKHRITSDSSRYVNINNSVYLAYKILIEIELSDMGHGVKMSNAMIRIS